MQAKKNCYTEIQMLLPNIFLESYLLKKVFWPFVKFSKKVKVSSHFPLIRECTDKPVNIWNRFYFILLMKE